jgi:hypothetical protein
MDTAIAAGIASSSCLKVGTDVRGKSARQGVVGITRGGNLLRIHLETHRLDTAFTTTSSLHHPTRVIRG